MVAPFPVDDDRESVHRLAVDQDVQSHQVASAIARQRIVHRGVALCACLQLVVEIYQHLGERHVVFQQDPGSRRAIAAVGHAFVLQILHALVLATPAVNQFHDGPDVAGRSYDAEVEPRLLNLVDALCRRQLGGVLYVFHRAVGQDYPVGHTRRRSEQVKVVLALQPLLNDVHVQQAKEAASKPGPECKRVFRLEDQGRVIELQLLQCLAQGQIILSLGWIESGEHHRLEGLIAFQRFVRPILG